jgi:hypothetical protein
MHKVNTLPSFANASSPCQFTRAFASLFFFDPRLQSRNGSPRRKQRCHPSSRGSCGAAIVRDGEVGFIDLLAYDMSVLFDVR